MFTGIVEAVGTVAQVAPGPAGARLTVVHPWSAQLALGESVSVNGCCVTVAVHDDERFTADLMGETLDRTTLGELEAADPVNLERALAADGRLGGHVVQGHVDGVGTVAAITPHDAWTVLAVATDTRLAPYLVEKGSIAVDGTSLTVMGVRSDPGGSVVFEVGLIPHTLDATVLGRRDVGDRVNLETDVLAKYVERLLAGGAATPYTPPVAKGAS
ncbi:MAG: riboflavin synthase [Actinobacteria bacterium]|nr:riboflavin synthase [Actinomycetota bacterium]